MKKIILIVLLVLITLFDKQLITQNNGSLKIEGFSDIPQKESKLLAVKKTAIKKPRISNKLNFLEVNKLLRKLWSDHVIFTLRSILSIVYDLPDSDAVNKRTLQNPEDFAKAFDSIFPGTGKQIKELLTEHFSIAGNLVKAAKNNDPSKEKLVKQFKDNGNDIANALAGILGEENRDALKKSLQEHADFVIKEATLVIQNKPVEEIINFDEYYNHALTKLADVLTQLIFKKIKPKSNKASSFKSKFYYKRPKKEIA